MKQPYVLPPGCNIDDSETLVTFGYAATSVSPSSSKKVVCYCCYCNKRIERIRIRIRPPVLCHSCVKSKKQFGDPSAFIDDDKTKKKFGYTSKQLARYSLAKVMGICHGCGTRYEVRMKSVKPAQLCRSCTRKAWCDNHITKREQNGHRLLNDKKTLQQYAYKATELSPQSFKHVVANCPCGRTFTRIRRNIHDNSVCIPCARHKINHEQLQRKRQGTMFKNYPNGFVVNPSYYGKVVKRLATTLEKKLGRKLTREKILSDGKRLDLYDPQKRIGIEYCGLHWHHEHSQTPRGRDYHRNKMLTAQKDGYRLITIFEDEYQEHEQAVVNWLLNILGAPASVVYARNCGIEEVPIKLAKAFLDEYHIQGSPHSISCAFGLWHSGGLVALVTGGQHHRQGHQDALILSRLCFAPGYRVGGGTERLYKRLKTYARENGYTKIVTWSDNRWSEGKVYDRLGMTLEKELRPDYSYVDMALPRKRLSKQSQKKAKTGCAPEVTERDWALKRGLSRIWDCGRKRWTILLQPSPKGEK